MGEGAYKIDFRRINVPQYNIAQPPAARQRLGFNSSPRHCALTDGTDVYDLRSAVECGGGSQQAL
jgi:hypothetical protein